jgi:hypothetical protein
MSVQLTTREKLHLWVAWMKSSLLVERMSYRLATSAAAVALVTLAMNNTAGGDHYASVGYGRNRAAGTFMLTPGLAVFGASPANQNRVSVSAFRLESSALWRDVSAAMRTAA